MMLPLFLRREAETDLQNAFDWYEERREGLGREFLSCVDAALERIRRSPAQHPLIHGEIRRALVRRFPYGVFYAVEQGRVLVYAVFHLKRNPAQLVERLSRG